MSAKTSNIVPPAKTSMLEIGSTQESTFTATGNEPGWRLDMGAQEITLLTNLGQTRVTGPRTAPQISVDTRRYVTTADGKQMTVTIVNRICNDSRQFGRLAAGRGMPEDRSAITTAAITR